ncbi:zinc finger, CCHC-type containing protein [Tanacetum coccineum]|uniref:Zinc finger, CCHC-type containing protein n=1 Tax=Tanacetum coccineum TaxID=301880 RepID=A0ABQ4XNJ8_9ASTR
MGDENPIRTLREYSKPSHEGYRNTIELPIGNNVSLRIRTNTSRTSLNLWTHLTLTVQIGKECACVYFNFPFVIKLAIGLNVFLQDPSPHGRILLLVSLFNSFHRGRTAKLRNDILMFQQHHGESLSEAWTRFKDLLQKVPHHGIDRWLQIQIFYDHVSFHHHVSFHLKCKIDCVAGGKLRNKNADES